MAYLVSACWVQEAVGDDPCVLYVRGLEAHVNRDKLAAMFQVGALASLHLKKLSVARGI